MVVWLANPDPISLMYSPGWVEEATHCIFFTRAGKRNTCHFCGFDGNDCTQRKFNIESMFMKLAFQFLYVRLRLLVHLIFHFKVYVFFLSSKGRLCEISRLHDHSLTLTVSRTKFVLAVFPKNQTDIRNIKENGHQLRSDWTNSSR